MHLLLVTFKAPQAPFDNYPLQPSPWKLCIQISISAVLSKRQKPPTTIFLPSPDPTYSQAPNFHPSPPKITPRVRWRCQNTAIFIAFTLKGGHKLLNLTQRGNPMICMFEFRQLRLIHVVLGISLTSALTFNLQATPPLFNPGKVIAWGDNRNGQATVPGNLTNAVSVAAGFLHTLVLTEHGDVVAWGYNDWGQTSVPASATNVVELAAGRVHSLALRKDGTVVAWGNNAWGQSNVPDGLSDVIAIEGGHHHSLALTKTGSVVAWGRDAEGQSTVPDDLGDVVAIAAGDMHSVALKRNGTVVAWGLNASGQTSVPVGLNGVVAISAGFAHSIAVKGDGSVIGWGDNSKGQLNVPANVGRIVSIEAGDFHNFALDENHRVSAWGDNSSAQIILPGSLTNVVDIDAGNYHGVAIVSETLPPVFCTPHKATAVAETINGFVVGATLTDSGCGYTNPPTILIEGGGGSGATAVAIVSEGRLSRIVITSAGFGYTSVPRILIASPPFVPSLSIAVSKVKVVQNVVLGRKYSIEASYNGIFWEQVISPFIANNESLTNEFDVEQTGRLFRIIEVP